MNASTQTDARQMRRVVVASLIGAYLTSASHPMAYVLPSFALTIAVVSVVSFVRARRSQR